MDLVSRLRAFIKYLEIGVSQFADNCGIPRPTLSQILSGRNKKISDELISKIHLAYPQLSVLWLLFNEGDMVSNKNIKISAPQSDGILDFTEPHSINNQSNTNTALNQETSPYNLQSSDFDTDIFNNINNPAPMASNDAPIDNNETLDEDYSETNDTSDQQSKNTSDRASKRIVNIMVFYDDNSFETFIPRQ